MAKQLQQKPLSYLETAEFCNQMNLMLRAGISTLEALNLLLEDAVSEEERHLLSQMVEDVELNGSLYQAAMQTGIFPAYSLSMFRLGEETGTLDTVTASLSAHYTRESNLANMLRSALVYPAIMLSMMILIIFVLLTQIMPVFQQVFQQLGQEMQGFSAVLLHIGEVLSRYSIFFIFVVIILGLFLFFNWKKLPFQRRFQEEIAVCRFADGMAIALKSGLTPEQGMDLVSELVENDHVAEKIKTCRSQMDDGCEFAEAIHQTQLFKGSYARIAIIAGKAGVMDEAMSQIASEYEYAVNTRINNLIALIEPTLVIILSLIVGVILFSVMLPLLGIMSGL